MNAILKVMLLTLISVGVIVYVDGRIKSHDMSFYQGKDDGLSARVYSIIILSFLLFVSYAKQHRIRMGLIGILFGFISSILGLFASYLLFDDYGLAFHMLSIVLVISIFIVLKSRKHQWVD